MSTENANEYEKVSVAVVVISKRGLIMTIFNEKWGSFSLPMTKLRRWEDPVTPENCQVEDHIDAAVRVAGELRGRTFTKGELPKFLKSTTEIRQSDRTGTQKLYTFHIYEMSMQMEERLRESVIAEWLQKEDIMNGEVFPISPTVKSVLEQL